MPDSLKFWIGLLVVAATILAVGWKQPLRYRFMSPEEIHALENPPQEVPPPPPPSGTWMIDPKRKTMLDEKPRTVRGGVNSYQSKGALDR